MRILVAATEPHIDTSLSSAWLCAHTNFSYLSCRSNKGKLIKTLSPKTKILRGYNFSESLQDTIPPSHQQLIIDAQSDLMSPINSHALTIDLIKFFDSRVILVASAEPGHIFRTLLNIETLHHRKIPIIGIIINGSISYHVRHAIEYYGQIHILAELANVTPSSIHQYSIPATLNKMLSAKKKSITETL